MASQQFEIPSICFRYVVATVTEEEILVSINNSFGNEYVKNIFMGKIKEGEYGNHRSICVHFNKLDEDPGNKNLSQFIELINSDKQVVFYYGTKINRKTGDLFFAKASKFVPHKKPGKPTGQSAPAPGMRIPSASGETQKKKTSLPKKKVTFDEETEVTSESEDESP